MKLNVKKTLIFSFLIIILTADLSYAQGGTPFGGRVTTSIYCACSNNWYLVVSSPRGGEFMYQPGQTILYEYRQWRQGVWLLGLWSGRRNCRQPSSHGCYTMASGNLITMMGTSR